MCTQARNVRSLAKKTCVHLMETRVDGVSTLDQCLGVDLDGLHARLVRVAYTRFADGVVAAARAEHLFVSLCSACRGGVLLSLLARGTAVCSSEVLASGGEAL